MINFLSEFSPWFLYNIGTCPQPARSTSSAIKECSDLAAFWLPAVRSSAGFLFQIIFYLVSSISGSDEAKNNTAWMASLIGGGWAGEDVLKY